MNLPQFSVKFPVTVTMIMCGIAILGFISFNRLGTDLLPSIYNPKIVVEIQSGERAPQDMEQRFTRRLEGSLATVSKVVDVRSVTSVGRVRVTTTFSWGTDMDFALLDVQKKVASFESDPEIDKVTVATFDPQEEPIMIYALNASISGDRDLDELRRLAEEVIKRGLERLDGVASVQTYGGIKQAVQVKLDEYLLAAYGLGTQDIKNKIRQANANASGGKLIESDKAYLIKGIGKYTNIEEVAATVIGYKSTTQGTNGESPSTGARQSEMTFSGDKVPILLSDVAEVIYAPEERLDIVRFNGEESIGLYIYKESKENTVRVAKQVTDEVVRLQSELPGLQFTQIYSQSSFIEKAIGEVETTAIIGIFLAILVLYVFLKNMGATLIVSLAIPISILATFTLMYFQRLTLNVMTLGGLALGAGMLVDNAIVVIENIFRRRQLGEDSEKASILGATEVGVAIAASTLTTIIVFLPIVYVQGVAAELFREQAWVVAFSLLSSLLVAFLLIPTLTAKLFRKKSFKLEQKQLQFPFYEKTLQWALNHRWIVVSMAVGLLVISIVLLPVIGSEFVPRSIENQLQIDIELTTGTPLDKTAVVIESIEHRIQQVLGEQLENCYSTINVQTAQSLFNTNSQQNEHQSTITLNLVSNAISPHQAIELLKPNLTFPGISTSFRIKESSLQQTIGTNQAPIVIEIRGEDLSTLHSLTTLTAEALSTSKTLQNITTSLKQGRPELRLSIDRVLAANFGLDVQQIGNLIQERLSGEVVSDFYSQGNDRDILVSYPKSTLTELKNLQIQTPTQAVLRLKDIVEFIPGEGPAEIHRHNQTRVSNVSAQLVEGITLSQAVAEIDPILANISLPPNYEIRFTGEEASRQESFSQLKFALLLSIILVYMVLASLFESLVHPFTILLTLPLAGVGVVLAFLLVGEPFSVMAYIGIIMLAGIAANDSIILVDYVNRLRADGKALRAAILQAGKDRLRPILMTSVTTILALLPLTIGIGEGTRLRAPMAIAVIGGLVTSTILTLVVIPVVYEIIDGLRRRAS